MRPLALRLAQGPVQAFAMVDDEDFERVSRWRWRLHSEGYAVRSARVDGRADAILLHREIMGLERGDDREVDHVNRDRLDCRRENLRVLERGANPQNASAYGRSLWRGVTWHAGRGRWQARVRTRFLGYFADELDAALAAENARLEVMPFAAADPELARAVAQRDAAVAA